MRSSSFNVSVSSSRSIITLCKEAPCLVSKSICLFVSSSWVMDSFFICVFAFCSLSHSALIKLSCCFSSDALSLSRLPFLRFSCSSSSSCTVFTKSTLCAVASMNRISRSLYCSSSTDRGGMFSSPLSSVAVILVFIVVNFSVVENKLLIVSWIKSCVLARHDAR